MRADEPVQSACGWRIAMVMRDGSTFATASKQIISDYDRFAQHMTKDDPPKKTTGGSKGRRPQGWQTEVHVQVGSLWQRALGSI